MTLELDCFLETDEVDEFFQDDIKRFALYYTNLFFKNKKDYLGYDIDQDFLESYISIVLDFDICDGMEIIYDTIFRNSEKFKKDIKFGRPYHGDIKYVLSLLNECAKLGIPKCFASGIIIIFLKACKGCKVEI